MLTFLSRPCHIHTLSLYFNATIPHSNPRTLLSTPLIGFGIPYTILVKNVSFFVGYGSYMALFPFCIMLGGISDYEKVGIARLIDSSRSYSFNPPYRYHTHWHTS